MTDKNFLGRFEDFRGAFCTTDEIENQLLTGSLPEGTTVADMRRAIDALQDVILSKKDAILSIGKLDAPNSEALAVCAETRISGKTVLITAEITNAGDPDDDNSDWFIVNPSFRVLKAEFE